MAILQKLKSLLGFDDSESERGGTREVGVTVEREGTADDGTAVDADRDEPVDDASAEPTQSAATGSRADDSTEPSEPTAAESADTRDESPVEEAEPDVAAEPEPDVETADSEPTPESAAAAETEADTESETADDTESVPDSEEPEAAVESESEAETEREAESESKAEAEAESEPETEPEGTNQEPVVEIKGIGPAYADRLAGAGIDTIGELADADAAELAEQTDISETRIQGWIDRAEVR
ncbi:helix-hairpin-helix domain-containing protein [Natrinema soli]|uniref:Helix-hairpin-helix domain-containing protein n=1 Tax=Natrinema soli TaxID=1930624 RepID=A0ABD5SVT8_9EURY|nr:helix-hairpin-helix domain-containing protein [Natrinema soli]